MSRLLFALALFLAALLPEARSSAQPIPPPALEARIGGSGARDMVVSPAGALGVPALPPDYVTVHRGPVRVSYPRALDAMVRATLARVERDARAVAAQLGVEEIPALAVRIVPDPEAMRALAPAALPPPPYAVGVAYPGARLALVSASAQRTWEASDMPRVLRHELSHLLLAEAAGHAELPRWLAEGIAVEQAGEHSFERFQELAVASFTGGILPLRRLDGGFADGPDVVNVAYAQSADLVAYLLRSDGAARFALMLAHLRAGMTLDAALRETYGASLAQIETEWRRDLEGRFALAPLWAGTGVLWFGAALLLVWAMLRRRRRSRETLDRWAREERRGGSHGLTVVTPGMRSAGEGAHATDEEELPRISLDGERHTLH